MKIPVRKIVHHRKIIDENTMKKYPMMIIIINLLVINLLQQLPCPVTNDDHHRMIMIIQIENQADQQHPEYVFICNLISQIFL